MFGHFLSLFRGSTKQITMNLTRENCALKYGKALSEFKPDPSSWHGANVLPLASHKSSSVYQPITCAYSDVRKLEKYRNGRAQFIMDDPANVGHSVFFFENKKKQTKRKNNREINEQSISTGRKGFKFSEAVKLCNTIQPRLSIHYSLMNSKRV